MSEPLEQEVPRSTRCKWLIGIIIFERMMILCYPSEGGIAAHSLQGLGNDLGLFNGPSNRIMALSKPECCGQMDFGTTEEVKDEEPSTGLQLDRLDMKQVTPAGNGTGGVYLLHDKLVGDTSVVFKPAEEENDSTHKDGYLKEYAAYVIDAGLAGVPETEVAVLDIGKGPQIGSVQRFVEDSEDAEDFGPGMFDVEDVQRIAVLDIRILNKDRHSGNLMRNKLTGKLVPIDHGTSFPSAFVKGELGEVSFEWLMYPQVKQPMSESLLKAIEDIDVNDDVEALSNAGLDEGVQLGNWMSTTFLKSGARHGRTLYDIGSMVQRKGDRSELSELEKVYRRAVEACDNDHSCDFFQVFQTLTDEIMTA